MELSFCVCVCLCLCRSLYGREVTVGYARLRGGMGATFCHLAALRSAIEFLFWDHWETAVLGQILAGRSRERISAIWRPLGRRLNFSSAIIGKRPFWGKAWPGGHGRFREVTGTEGENGVKCRVWSVKCGVWRVKCAVRSEECKV